MQTVLHSIDCSSFTWQREFLAVWLGQMLSLLTKDKYDILPLMFCILTYETTNKIHALQAGVSHGGCIPIHLRSLRRVRSTIGRLMVDSSFQWLVVAVPEMSKGQSHSSITRRSHGGKVSGNLFRRSTIICLSWTVSSASLEVISASLMLSRGWPPRGLVIFTTSSGHRYLSVVVALGTQSGPPKLSLILFRILSQSLLPWHDLQTHGSHYCLIAVEPRLFWERPVFEPDSSDRREAAVIWRRVGETDINGKTKSGPGGKAAVHISLVGYWRMNQVSRENPTTDSKRSRATCLECKGIYMYGTANLDISGNFTSQ